MGVMVAEPCCAGNDAVALGLTGTQFLVCGRCPQPRGQGSVTAAKPFGI